MVSGEGVGATATRLGLQQWAPRETESARRPCGALGCTVETDRSSLVREVQLWLAVRFEPLATATTVTVPSSGSPPIGSRRCCFA